MKWLLLLLLLVGCSQAPIHSPAEQIAISLVDAMQSMDGEKVHGLFVSEQQQLRQGEEIEAYMRASPRYQEGNFALLRLQKQNESLYFAEFNVSGEQVVVQIIEEHGQMRAKGLDELFTSTCPIHCADGVLCTRDVCDSSTSFRCEHEPIIPCLGNDKCEEGEYPGEDCPNCEDQNICTKNQYNYTMDSCQTIDLIPCCGDHACDEGETRDACPKDCSGTVFTVATGEREILNLLGKRYQLDMNSFSLDSKDRRIAHFDLNNETFHLPLGQSSNIAPGIAISFDFITQSNKGFIAAIALYEDRR